MKILDRAAAGDTYVAIVGGMHGDEPAGWRIVNRIADELPAYDADEGEGRIRLIIANEPAIEAETRYTETDLNRAFPGDTASDAYEDRLAVDLAEAVAGADAVLAIHTSHSAPPPFAIYSELTPSVRRSVAGMPVDYVLDASGLRGTTFDSTVPHTVSIEVGRQGSEEAVDFGYTAVRAFLRAHGSLADQPPTFSETTIVKGLEEVPKGGGDPQVNYANFEEIPSGAVFASDDVYTHRVDESGLVPVLASEEGYENLFGLYGRIAGTLEPPADSAAVVDDD